MNEEEKEDIELDIEAKYVDKTEKEFLSRVTYAECLYILTPKNKYCDKIRELSVLKLCEIIEKLQKENEELKRLMAHKNGYTKLLEEDLFENCSNYVIPIQTIKGKIEESKQEKEKYGNCLIKMYEDELVNRDIKILQELLEGRK